MNKIQGVLMIGLVLISMESCIEHTPNSKKDNYKQSSQEDKNFIKKADFKGFRMYAGSIPCADCDQIDQRLVIKGDSMGVFRLTETYRNASEEGDAVLVCTGEWKFTSKKKDLIYLSVGDIADSVRTMDYKFFADRLVQFKQDNEPVNSSRYVLKKIKASSGLE
jgi:hypothetical protein